MNYSFVNASMPASATFDLNAGMLQMAQMPLRNDVVKTIIIDAPGLLPQSVPANGMLNPAPLPNQPLLPGTPIDPNKPKNATADVNPNIPGNPNNATPEEIARTEKNKKQRVKVMIGLGLVLATVATVMVIKNNRQKTTAKLAGAVSGYKKSKRPTKRKTKHTSKKSSHKVVTI